MKINRRDFIKTGGMVMLGSLAVPSFLGSCTGNKVDQATGISFAQNHFGSPAGATPCSPVKKRLHGSISDL